MADPTADLGTESFVALTMPRSIARPALQFLQHSARGFLAHPADTVPLTAPQLVELLGPVPVGARGDEPEPGRVETPAFDGEQLLTAPTPMAYLVSDGHAETTTPTRDRVVVDAADLVLLDQFRSPAQAAGGVALAAAELGDASIAAVTIPIGIEALRVRLARLRDHGLLHVVHAGIDGTASLERGFDGSTQRTVSRDFDRRKALIAAEQRRRHEPHGRIPVIPVYEPVTPPNLGLGLILAYATQYEDGRLLAQYEFEPNWVVRPAGLRRRLAREGPAVLLFSNYVWSHDQNLAIAKLVKEASPESITIHGGPDTPKFPDDIETYFEQHPYVDIAVRNEGEVAVAEILTRLDGSLAGRGGDLSVLADVPGIAFRDGARVVRTPDRARIDSLDALPSPYLTGLFDDFADLDLEYVIIETNRGCPYGCTFCDWGSATMSRIRKFELDRVFAELEWAARSGAESVWLADANFGMLARDVEIAQTLAELKERYGRPTSFAACWAKNNTKHIEKIIDILTEGGIAFTCTLALQSTDPGVLKAVHRTNIKTEAYDRLATTLRKVGATLASDIMLGLPGTTLASFSSDLQACIDREIFATIYYTALLVNSPMNEPEYRTEHAIGTAWGEATPGQRRKMVVSTSTYTRDDFSEMVQWRRMFRVFENAGLLRFVARWVRHETGRREIDLYIAMDRAAREHPDTYPYLHWLLYEMTEVTEPASWTDLYAEVRRYLVDELGLAPSPALDTILEVQLAFAPWWGRTFPVELDLRHDFEAWYLTVREQRETGDDWVLRAPHLDSYPPAAFVIDDSTDANRELLGSDVQLDYFATAEYDSAIMRGRSGRYVAV